jgi:hypothetical protein
MSWWRVAIAAVLLTTITSQVFDIVRNSRPWWAMLPLGFTVVVAAFTEAAILGDWLFVDEMLVINRGNLSPLVWLYGCFTTWLLALTAAAMSLERPAQSTWIRFAVRSVAVLILLPILCLLASIYWHMLSFSPAIIVESGRENALPRVLELAADYPEQTGDDAVLAEVITLLKRPGFVEPGSVRPDLGTGQGAVELVLPRKLARGLMAKSDALRGAGKFDEAADYALAILRLGEMYGREGTAHHRLEAEALFHMGHAKFAECRRQISRTKANEAAELVRSISAARESIAVTAARDAALTQRSKAWRHRLHEVVLSELWNLGAQPSPAIAALSQPIQKNQTFAGLLTFDLLLRVHRMDHRNWPAKLEDVVPAGEDELVIDPYSLQPFIYRPAEPEFVLYSVGKDGKDDGGRFSNHPTAEWFKRIDVDTDTLIRP